MGEIKSKIESWLTGVPSAFLRIILVGLALFALYAAAFFGPFEMASVAAWYIIP